MENLTWKNFLIALAIFVLGFFGVKYVINDGSSPTPEPTPTATVSPLPTATPSATPTASPSPTPTVTAGPRQVRTSLFEKPTPGVQPVLQDSVSLSLWKGEETGFLVTSQGCLTASQPAEGVTIRLYEAFAINTKKPTTLEIKTGDHLDALIQKSEVCSPWKWVDVAVSRAAAQPSYSFTIGDLPVTVAVDAKVMPVKPTIPMYLGLQPYAILNAHGIPTAGVSVQGPLVKKYVDLLRAHRIEPFAQYLAAPPVVNGMLNIDNWKDLNGSFRQLVIDGAIAPPMVLGFGDSYSNTAYLKAVNATVAAESGLAGAWAYVIDEPSAAQQTEMTTRINALIANAPLLKRLVTTSPKTGVDYPVVNFDITQPTGFHWAYGSCMSHASCDNSVTAAKGTGTPDLMLDQPSIHARMFPIVAAGTGAKGMLYYTANEGYAKRLDPWVDQYMFGGNGDGQLVYPAIPGQRGFTTHDVVGSIRLKMLRQGMNDLEHLLANGKISALVINTKVWTKLHSEIESMR